MIVLDKIVIALISPFGTGLFLGVAGIVLVLLDRRWRGLVFILAGFGWMTLWSLPVVSARLVNTVERHQFPVDLADIPYREAIIVLGGGVSPSLLPAKTGQAVSLGDAADRVWLGAKLYGAGKAPLIVMSGGSLWGGIEFAEAEAMAEMAAELGVPRESMVLEPLSRNTRENARFTALLLREQGIRSIILVTSAYHMPRAEALFQHQGLDVFAVPTDYIGPGLARQYCCLPDTGALDVSGRMFKELIGKWVNES